MPVNIPNVLDDIEKIRGEPTKNIEAIPLGDDLKKMVQIGVNLKPDLKDKMIKFL